ncbi:MAG: alpha-glucan family phosphorylase [Sedimentisphaerales bacterium]|nr:alpha-glucan family phosphorylase [Sedimentisphaerales bacterium]
MPTVRSFVVVPSLPEKLKRLKDVAENVCWCWDRDTIELFRRLDRDLWEQTNHNPMLMFSKLSQQRLDAASKDDGLAAHMRRVCTRLDNYIQGSRWYDAVADDVKQGVIAYFSAEFGIHECLPLYSGGLGVLAGDHLKSASDLGLPLVGVGLLYRQGYFQQYLNADGWQQESYPENDFYNMPVTLVLREDGRPVRFHIDIAGHDVVVQIWRIKVGRIDLYLLDTNLRCNRIEDRQITAQLYGGDTDMRLRQEILLGIGGFNALRALNIDPSVCHMNEGHAAFMSLERIRYVMQEHQLSFAQAKEATAAGNVFTTHTPVPAGHDVFTPTMMEKYFSEYYKSFGLSWKDFLALGRADAADTEELFSMTVLALHMSTYRNGVSRLHGEVSRHMCQPVWPGVPVQDIPVTSVTNGVHVRSWISRDMTELLDRYLGPAWAERPNNKAVFDRIDQIPDEELWRTHERRRERLVAYARQRLRDQLSRRGASPLELAAADEVLDPEALTIGFARRFATYKRGTLLFRDLKRLKSIVCDKERPVQLIFAGKAHPRDTEGKELIRELVHEIRDEELRRRIVFLENYDINVARNLVQGVDVWLNTPRRGMEASGTSGMKVLGNGGLNMSVLDGWWCEGYSPDTGWAIGSGESYTDREYEDEVESHTIYDLLEKEIVPTFYQRGRDHLPRLWVRKMKGSMRELISAFSTNRMVSEYAERFYITSAQRWNKFKAENWQLGKSLADWKESMRDRWSEVAVEKVDVVSRGDLFVGGSLEVRCQVKLGTIDPTDVVVELYYGLLGPNGEIQQGQSVNMQCSGSPNDNTHVFSGNIPCLQSGRCGFSVCVVPNHPEMVHKYDTGLLCWDEAETPARTKATTQA